MNHQLSRGIVGVVQTPFDHDGTIDNESLLRLVDASIAAGVTGFVSPAVASEVESLSTAEREQIVRLVSLRCAGRVPLIVGGSSNEIEECAAWGRIAREYGAAALLVAVPAGIHDDSRRIIAFFAALAARIDVPLIVQDLNGRGRGWMWRRLPSWRPGFRLLSASRSKRCPRVPNTAACGPLWERIFGSPADGPSRK